MNGQRRRSAAAGILVVGIAVVVATVLVVSANAGSGAFSPSDGLLTAADLPGYSLTRQDEKSRPVNGETSPASCREVIAEQDRRVQDQKSVSMIAVAASDDLPTVTQSILTGGPSVDQSRYLVSRCPEYTKRAGAESVTTTTTVMRTPDQCPADAFVVRMRTQLDTAQQQSDSTAIVGYVQGRSSVGVLTQASVVASDRVPDTFCRLLGTVQSRIGT